MANIGIQLYTVRDVAGKLGYESAIRQVGDAGYRYVETAGFPGSSPEQAAKLFKELGMTVVASHTGNPVGDKKNEILDALDVLGKPRLIVPGVDHNMLKTEEGIKRLSDWMNEGARNAMERGIRLGFHNHWIEYGNTEEGQPVYKLMAKYLDPSVFFELDLYWIKVAGIEPAEIIREMGERAPLLHIKDGPANTKEPMTAVGEGVMDWKKILPASEHTAEYWIVEMDAVAGDPIVEIRKSFDFLKNFKA